MDETPQGTVKEITVRLDSTDGPGGVAVYRPGQMVTGRVRLRLLKPLTVRNIDLLVQGSSTVGWGKGGGHFVQDDEIYVNDMAELVATGRGEIVTLSPGEHVFPFACSLPRHLPATFSGGFGKVAYAAKVVMQATIPDAGGPWISTAPFAVESELPRDEHAELLTPCFVKARMMVGSGPGGRCLKVSLALPKRVFAAQEDLVVTASVVNRSRRTIARLSAGLVMDCLYHAGGQHQFKETLLVADRVDEYRVGHMEARCWKNVRLRIPPLIPPSGLPHCRLVSVSYSLLFRAEVENCPKDLNLRVPIIVGVASPSLLPEVTSVSSDFPETVHAEAEPEVMRPMSHAPSGSDDESGLDDAAVWREQRERQPQPPVGSTEKRIYSGYYMFDPASQKQLGSDGVDEVVGRYPLPADIFAPSANGENLY